MGLKKTGAKKYLLGIMAIIYMFISVINPALQFTWMYIIFFVSYCYHSYTWLRKVHWMNG